MRHSLSGLEHFGFNFRRKRRELEISQAAIARRLGTTQSVVSRIENGLRPSPEQASQLARAIGEPLEVLLRPKSQGDTPAVVDALESAVSA